MQGFAARLTALTASPCVPPHLARVEIDLDGERWSLQAAFADLRPAGLLRWRYADTSPADRLAAWFAHLLLCAGAPAGVERQTIWLSRDGEFFFEPCDDPVGALGGLLRLVCQGLSEPLYFFPKSAWVFIDNGESRSKARGKWHNSQEPAWGEDADPAYRLALRGLPDPMDEAGFGRFGDCARAVFGPLKAHLVDTR